METQPAPPKGGRAPSQFSANFYCAQTAGCTKLSLGVEVGLRTGDFVLDGEPAPLLKRGRSPLHNFRPIYILAKRLDASKCHLVWMLASAQGICVRWRPSLPSPTKGAGPPPNFGSCLFWPNGLMDQDANWYEGRPRLRPLCVTWAPSSPTKKAHPPMFGPCLLWSNGWMD